MKKKIFKLIAFPVVVFISILFLIPSGLYAEDADQYANAVDAKGYPGEMYGTEIAVTHAIFDSFGNLTPQKGSTFAFMSTGNAFNNKDGTSNDGRLGNAAPDWAELDIGPIKIPSGKNEITFSYYYMTRDVLDYFKAEIYGSSVLADGTTIAYADPGDCGPEGSDLDGTAFDGTRSTGWIDVSAAVAPGDRVTIKFYITDTDDDEVDSAVIIDNFPFSKSKGEEEVVWVRTMPMTCWQVWINEDNNFQFIFWYPYKDNNWVRIYDMEDNLVHETDLSINDPNLIVDLPDGFYMVKTFHHDKLLQEFLIGKP